MTPRDETDLQRVPHPAGGERPLVYPVVSRRAGGLSIGVNLNPNRACNWRCIYCEVEGLIRGVPPAVELERLEQELGDLLVEIQSGSWLARNAPPEIAVLRPRDAIKDVAIAGDGEPTLSPSLPGALAVVGKVLERRGLRADVDVILITNGSRVHRAEVQESLRRLNALGGQAWFKLDAGTEEGRARINDTHQPDARVKENLAICAAHAATWIQTMVVAIDGRPPSEEETRAWLALVAAAPAGGARLQGVQLYGLARPSHQPEAPRLTRVEDAWLEELAERVRALGLPVRVYS